MGRGTAIVSGGSRGIGKETAIQLARMGLNVAICSRTQSEVDLTVKEISAIAKSANESLASKNRVLGVRCDISNVTEVEYFVKSAIEQFVNIHILVNNAGIVYVKKLVDTSENEWDKTIDINLKGAFLLSRAVLPFMMKNSSSGGVIINVSSGAGKAGFPDISAYCASKFGMIGLTESLAWEVQNFNIKVMAICPGEVDTKMQRDVDSEYYSNYRGKMLKPGQVADRIIDMIFNDKKYQNGQSVDIG